ncbi:MAG: RelA/SpoT family protein [Candidatus Berkelbacteria bacterium]|nr:RelA/SpoT family protein [Candidatus Berkelbacteria bacterium]
MKNDSNHFSSRAKSRDLSDKMIPSLFEENIKPLVSKFAANEKEKIAEAFRFAKNAHLGQKRVSGEDFIIHPVLVAKSFMEVGADSETVIAALLHDAIEDTSVTKDEISKKFGPTVADLVDGVTKISSIKDKEKLLLLGFEDKFQTQIDNYRKLLTKMAGDPRVIAIKLYDRLHNVQTLEWLPETKRQIYARETIEIYSVLAERLGFGELKGKLNDLCFEYAYPQEYDVFIQSITIPRQERERYITKIIMEIKKHLFENKIKFQIYGRVKRNYSLYSKLKTKNGYLGSIYDLVAIRIIASDVADCYKILGLIHKKYPPLIQKFHDYIARPKENGYQSLHTVVFGPEKKSFEIQIRTEEMDKNAEFGVASHWNYKEKTTSNLSEKIGADWQEELSDDDKNQKLFANKIFAFTPVGKIFELRRGATVIDFAFLIHSDLGLSCAGAKINGKIAPISTELLTGDVVEILKSPRPNPSRDWLRIAKTGYAKTKIRKFFAAQNRLDDLEKVDVLKPVQIKKRRLTINQQNFKITFENGNFPYRLAKCCNPKSSDDVVGYITSQKEISVHKSTCSACKKFLPARIVQANWSKTKIS